MKILLVSDFYPPYPGGLEQHVQALAHHLAGRDHEIQVATLARPSATASAAVAPELAAVHDREDPAPPMTQDEAGEATARPAVTIRPTLGLPDLLPLLSKDANRRYPLPMLDPLAFHRLRRLVHQFQPDVIHAHGWSAFTALHLNQPVVITLHDSGLFCPKRTLLRNEQLCLQGAGWHCLRCARSEYGLAKSAAILTAMQLGRSSLAKAKAYIAVSSFVRESYLRFAGLAPEQVVTIPNFFREDESPPATPTAPLPWPVGSILYVGYLARYKGAHILLEAYSRLKTTVPLVMIGYPTEELQILDRRVQVIKGAPHAVVMRALEECLFAVVPSIVPDSLPTVALEAMSRGKAIVASAIGGLPDLVVDGQTGLLSPAGDVAALADRLARLLDDPALAQRLGEAGRQRLAESFSVDVVVPRIEALYRRIA